MEGLSKAQRSNFQERKLRKIRKLRNLETNNHQPYPPKLLKFLNLLNLLILPIHIHPPNLLSEVVRCGISQKKSPKDI